MAPASKAAANERVVLLHGLGESPLIMAPLALVLSADGYDVTNIAYPSTLAPAETLVADFITPLLTSFPEAARLHFVTHSLGGVLLHAGLQGGLPANLGRVVMTSPGLHGSEAIEVYRHNWLYRMAYGPAAYQSGIGDGAFAYQLDLYADYELGIISGCTSSDPIANLIIPWPHDGKISVARTRMAGMADHLVLPLPHDDTSRAPVAIMQIQRFLRTGAFLHLFKSLPSNPLQNAA